MEAVKPSKKKSKKVRELSPPKFIPSDLPLDTASASSGDNCLSKAAMVVEENLCLEEPTTSRDTRDFVTANTEGPGEANLESPSTSLVESQNIDGDSSVLADASGNSYSDDTILSPEPTAGDDSRVAVAPTPPQRQRIHSDFRELGETALTCKPEKQELYPTLDGCKALDSTQSYLSTETFDSSLKSPTEMTLAAFGDGLMSEDQLLHFYRNILYETAEDFVDSFVENEYTGGYELSEYLKRYKLACQELQEAGIEIGKCQISIQECVQCVWKEKKCVSTETGKCGDQKSASGEIKYTTAEMQPEKLTELSELLKNDTKLRLDSSLCSDIKARSLALQIQWQIVDLNNTFMSEYSLGSNSLPKLLYEIDNKPVRLRVRRALSDLFHCLRYPQLPSAFTKSVINWILELSAVLLKACTCTDQEFLLCHILRLPPKNSTWTAALIQTYIKYCTDSDQLVIDNFLAMLSILLSPIRGREEFLKCILSSEEEDRSWNIVSEDLVEDDISLTAVDETDLVAFLNQFSVEALFKKAVNYFGSIYRLNPLSEVLSLMAFQLVLMKIFDNGLVAYAEDRFRQLCKQIGQLLKKSVKFLSEFWQIKRDILLETDRMVAQREFDRVVLQALYYIVGKKSLGLYQFLVDLPYEAVSESCKERCQLLLRKTIILPPSQLYNIPEVQLSKQLGSDKLLDRLNMLSKDDSNYLIVALAALIAVSDSHVQWFLMEVFDVCFIDESTRDDLYKVGAEAVSTLLEKHPTLLGRVLSLIDRNVDTLEQYALEVLSTAPLSKCIVTASDVGSVCGKWLINRTPEHPASRIARRVLSSLNWGLDNKGKLWLDEAVHCECAETVVKGHMAQCKHTNGLIAKSLHKIAKLVLKVPDYEYQFETFCWDVLLRLKLPRKTGSSTPLTDLTAYYVHIIQYYLVSPDEFFSKGRHLWSELVASGCYRAASVIVAQLIISFPETIKSAIQDESFIETFDQLLHSDQSAYAVQLIAGADDFPGPTVRLFEALIAHSLTENCSLPLLNAWVDLLCSSKSVNWTGDNAVLYLLSFMCEFCFVKDSSIFFSLVQILQELCALNFQQWKTNNGKGLFAWLTSDGCAPVAVNSNSMGVAPWATYALLLAEERAFSAFYEAFYTSLNKHPKYTVEQCQKKASAKSHIPVSVENLHFVRWLQFACLESVEKHPCFPLICYSITQHLFCRNNIPNCTTCFANQYFTTECAKPLFEKLLKNVLPRLELEVTGNDKSDVSLLYKAFGQWLTNIELRAPQFTGFSNLLLGNVIQKLISNDTSGWRPFVNCQQIASRQLEVLKTYASVRHWGVVYGLSQPASVRYKDAKLTDLLTSMNTVDQTVQFPCLIQHNALPQKLPLSTTEDICNVDYCLSLFGQQLQTLSAITREYVTIKDSVDGYDTSYLKELPNLYASTTVQVPVVLSCGSFGKCSRPVSTTVSKSVMKRQAMVETSMEANRQERLKALTSVAIRLLDFSAITCAHLDAVSVHSNAEGLLSFKDRLKTTGRTLFYHLISNASALDMLFIASASTYEFILKRLGETFIANQASEQFRLMNVALSCSHLNHLIALYFTPECLSPQQLVDVYQTLSQAIKTPITAPLALKLLSRLDIKNAGARLPTEQFSELMPLAFENLTSLNDVDSSTFYGLCFDHFMHSLFHHFPTNFISGMSLILSACDSNSTPPSIFERIITDVGANTLDDPTHKPAFTVDAKIGSMGCDIIAAQLAKSRSELGSKLFTTWSKYLDHICILIEFFVFKSAVASFDSSSSANRIEGDLQTSFERAARSFGPLLEPFGPGTPPWNIDDIEIATSVVDRFTSLMKRLHLIYDASLPPGSENLVALLCNYYGTKLAFAATECAYVYELLESRLTNVPWNIFLPNLVHLSVIEHTLKDSLSNCGQLLTEILVRLPWQTVFKQQVYLQPADATRAFLGLLLSIVARCVSYPKNYAKCPASMSKLFTTLSHYEWSPLRLEDLEAASTFVAASFPPSYLCDPNEVTSSFFTMYRKICFFSTIPSGKIALTEEYKKQAVYLHMLFSLMIRSGNNTEWIVNYYMDQVAAVNSIIAARNDFSKSPAHLAAEFSTFWSTITDAELGEALVKGLCSWLLRNNESQLVLLTMNTVIGSLCENQIITGLKVIEKCIVSFFQRSTGCTWETVVAWATIPESCEYYLFNVPSSDRPGKLLLLTLNVFLLQRLGMCSSSEQETAILKKFLDYMANLRPKYIEDEAAFVVLLDKLQNLVLRQFNYNIRSGNEFLTSYLGFLEKIYSDDKNASFFSKLLVKKSQYPVRLRLITQTLHLYVTQQTVSPNRPPRASGGAPVLNSRIQAYKDMCSVKSYADHKNLLAQIQPFFLQFQNYHIGHLNELLVKLARSLFSEKYVT